MRRNRVYQLLDGDFKLSPRVSLRETGEPSAARSAPRNSSCNLQAHRFQSLCHHLSGTAFDAAGM